MSTTNDAILYSMGIRHVAVTDNQSALNTAQGQGTPVIGSLFRVTNSVANGACTLKSSLTNEAQAMVFVINDSPNTIKVFSSVGENQSGSANASLSIPTGQSGVFVRIPVQTSKGGGGGGTLDWRSAVIA